MLVLGVLDCIPHNCIFDQEFLETKFNKSIQLERQLFKFLSATLYLEWLSTMVSTGLLPMQRSQGQSLIIGEKIVMMMTIIIIIIIIINNDDNNNNNDDDNNDNKNSDNNNNNDNNDDDNNNDDNNSNNNNC